MDLEYDVGFGEYGISLLCYRQMERALKYAFKHLSKSVAHF